MRRSGRGSERAQRTVRLRLMSAGRCIVETRFPDIPGAEWQVLGVWMADSAAEFAAAQRALEGRGDVLERLELVPCTQLRELLTAARDFEYPIEARATFVSTTQ